MLFKKKKRRRRKKKKRRKISDWWWWWDYHYRDFRPQWENAAVILESGSWFLQGSLFSELWRAGLDCSRTVRSREFRCRESCNWAMGSCAWDKKERGRVQPLKEWHSHWGYDINWLELIRPKMAEESTSRRTWALSYVHCNTFAKWHVHRHHDSFKADHKRAVSWAMAQFPEITSPLQNSCNYPPEHISLQDNLDHKN